MLYLVLLTIVFASLANAQETETHPEGNKSQCINQMVQWCNGMQYSQNGTHVSMISIVYGDSNNYYRVLCIADSEGTNCSRNGSPWFTCAPDHTLTYKGQVLTEASTDVDDDICNTTRKAFNELSVQSMSNTRDSNWDMEKYMKDFYDEMASMRNLMRDLQMRLSSGVFDGFGNRGAMFPEFDFFDPNDSSQASTEDSNQIEEYN